MEFSIFRKNILYVQLPRVTNKLIFSFIDYIDTSFVMFFFCCWSRLEFLGFFKFKRIESRPYLVSFHNRDNRIFIAGARRAMYVDECVFVVVFFLLSSHDICRPRDVETVVFCLDVEFIE